MLVSSDAQLDYVFTNNNEIIYDEDIEEDESDIDNIEKINQRDAIYNWIMTGALLLDFGVEYNNNEAPDLIEEYRSDIIPMRQYARMHKLDTTQRKAFELICCTFMLDCIGKVSLHYDL